MSRYRYFPSFSTTFLPRSVGPLQRKCACGKCAAGADEQCEDCKRKKALGLQHKLAQGQVDDVYEREADRVAGAVTRAGDAGPTRPAPPRIQRLPATAAEPEMIPASVDRTLARAGRPLDPTARTRLEPRFGVSFADVRVHDDDHAAASAREINAHAYTRGRDIVFAPGRYRPRTAGGLRLLAHELTHVLQQTGAADLPVQRDLAIEPQAVDKKERPLSEQDIRAAIQFNKRRIKNKKSLREIRDVIGISPEPAVSDRNLALGVARWQSAHGVAQDGQLGAVTVMLLVEELQAESDLVSGLAADAETLRKAFSKKDFLDVDTGFCGCDTELKRELNAADRFIGHYTACGADPTNKTGSDIENCVQARAPGAKVMASTSSTGAITANCPRTGPCAKLLCQIDLAHEQIHSVHTGELRQQHGAGTAAFNTAFNDAKDWVADEVNSRNTDKSLAKWALKVLERTCP